METITSKHVYSVSATALSDSAQLWAADRELPPVASSASVDEWNTIHETSAISCSNIDRRIKAPKKTVVAPSPVVRKTFSTPSITKEPSLVKQSSSTSDSAKEEKPEEVPAPAPAKALSAKKSGIMGMFAASAAKSVASGSKSTASKTANASTAKIETTATVSNTAPSSTPQKQDNTTRTREFDVPMPVTNVFTIGTV